MDKQQRIRQILYRQHLTAPADPKTVLQDLNGVQAQFLGNARHGLQIRCSVPLPEDSWGDGLVKSWSVRGTMHLFAEEDLPLFLHKDRSHFLRPVDRMKADKFIPLERKRYFAAFLVKCIGGGIEEREALKAACMAEGLTEEEAKSVFDPWGGTIRYLCESGQIAYKVQQKKAYRLCPAFAPMEREEALLEMAGRYFRHFGPATVKDAAYYFGFSQSAVKELMKKLPLREQVIDGVPCYELEDGQDDFPDIPDCIFLSGFDQLMLGYDKRQSPFLRPVFVSGIFSRAGIVMPGVLFRGEVAGRWKMDGGKLLITLFAPLPASNREIIADAAAYTFGPVQISFVEP